MVNQALFGDLTKYLFTIFLGAIFAFVLYHVWDLQFRWFVVVITAIVMLAISMMLVSVFSDFLFISLMFSIPLSGFMKFLFVDFVDPDQLGNVAYSGAIGVGLLDFLLVGLLVNWFYRVFITQEQPLPSGNAVDIWVFGILIAYLLSVPGTPVPMLSIHAVLHLLKHVVLYLYISRNIQVHHLPWFLIAIGTTILMETGLGLYQYQTGSLLGIALDKGAGGENLEYQYDVPGLNRIRATGTAYDSHSLGLMMALLAPYPFLLMFTRGLSAGIKFVSIIIFMLLIITLVLSFSRSAWLSCFIGIGLMAGIMLFRWKESQVIIGAILALIIALISLPWSMEYIYNRFVDAPSEVLDARFEMWEVAYHIWLDHPFFGFGVGNYMEALKTHNFNMAADLPVHNVFLWILAESGVFGVIAFFGLIFYAMLKLWGYSRQSSNLISRLSLAILIGLFIYCLDGITDPLFREPVIFVLFWFLIAITAAIPRLQRDYLQQLDNKE